MIYSITSSASTVIMALLAVGALLGITFAYFARTKDTENRATMRERADNWQGVAESREAELKDANERIARYEKVIAELRTEMTAMRTRLAELERHSMEAVLNALGEIKSEVARGNGMLESIRKEGGRS